jgi:hypothetical protein
MTQLCIPTPENASIDVLKELFFVIQLCITTPENARIDVLKEPFHQNLQRT